VAAAQPADDIEAGSLRGEDDALYSRTRETLVLLQQELLLLRDQLRRDLVGQEVYQWPYEPIFRTVSAREVDAWFETDLPFASGLQCCLLGGGGSLVNIKAALFQLEADYEIRLNELTSSSEFSKSAYDKLISGIDQFWKVNLFVTNNFSGQVSVFNAQAKRIEARQQAERNALSARPNATEADREALRRQHEAEWRGFFDDVLGEYGSIVTRLADVRARWAAEVWEWQNYAVSRNSDAGDVHALAAVGLVNLNDRAFADPQNGQDPQLDSTTSFFLNFPGSPDLFYFGSGWDAYSWCAARPAPDIQREPGNCGRLTMGFIGEIPVDQLGTRAPLRTDFEDSGSGGRPEYVPGGPLPPAPFDLAN